MGKKTVASRPSYGQDFCKLVSFCCVLSVHIFKLFTFGQYSMVKFGCSYHILCVCLTVGVFQGLVFDFLLSSLQALRDYVVSQSYMFTTTKFVFSK